MICPKKCSHNSRWKSRLRPLGARLFVCELGLNLRELAGQSLRCLSWMEQAAACRDSQGVCGLPVRLCPLPCSERPLGKDNLCSMVTWRCAPVRPVVVQVILRPCIIQHCGPVVIVVDTRQPGQWGFQAKLCEPARRRCEASLWCRQLELVT